MYRTITGQIAPLYDEKNGIVCPFDIVYLLGREPRFGNNGDREYTVLHHSVLCAFLWMIAGFPIEGLIHILTHDCHEAYTKDIPSPIKNATKEVYEAISSLEDMLDGKLRARLGIETPDELTRKRIKICDQAALIIEFMIVGPPGSDNIEQLKKDYPEKELWDLVYKAMPNLEYVSNSIKRKKADYSHPAYGKQGEQ